jgi:hypothetical protein
VGSNTSEARNIFCGVVASSYKKSFLTYNEIFPYQQAGNFNFTPYIPLIYPYIPPYIIPLIYRVYKRLDTRTPMMHGSADRSSSAIEEE